MVAKHAVLVATSLFLLQSAHAQTRSESRPETRSEKQVEVHTDTTVSPVGPTQTRTRSTTRKKTETKVETPTEVIEETTEETIVRNVPPEVEEPGYHSADVRAQSKYSVMLVGSPVDLLIPYKLGGALGYISSSATTNELEYVGASISAPAFIEDIGGFHDSRWTLQQRLYSTHNSFNFHYGLAYFDISANVGSKYLASATNLPANVNLMGTKSLGFMIGVGNRWVLGSGFSIGVDWISWSQPLLIVDKKSDLINYVQNSDDKRVLETAINVMTYFPRVTLLKLGIGFIF